MTTETVAPAFDIIPHTAEASISTSVISTRHVEIGEEFLSRVKGMIEHVPSKIMHYGVKRAQASWDSDDETIKLDFDGNRRLVITMETKTT